MKKSSLAAVMICLCYVSHAASADLTFLTPDGKPAAGTKLYQTFLEPSMRSSAGMMGGMEMMYGEEMGMGMGMDAMEESEEMYGDDYGMDEMMGMEDMMMGGGGPQRPKSDILSFLNGNPLPPTSIKKPNGNGAIYTADRNGVLPLDGKTVVRRRGVNVHRVSAVAVHETGFSFIPAGTRLGSTVKLRRYGKINVRIPETFDSNRYQALICWQNGFAYPSLAEYRVSPFSNPEKKSTVNRDDWRFKPRFRWYQTGALGETLSVPPGEIRVTLIRKGDDEPDLSDLNSQKVFERLTTLGPSTIVVASGRSASPVNVQFAALRTLVLRIPEIKEDTLPQWGDRPRQEYRLSRFIRNSTGGDSPVLSLATVKEMESQSAVTTFLNSKREERSRYPEARYPTAVQGRELRFDLLRPGWYVLEKLDEQGERIRAVAAVNWNHQEGISYAQINETNTNLADMTFEMVASENGSTTFRWTQTVANVINNQRSDEEKLKLVRALRKELETAMKRLMEHRRKLVLLEAKLQKSQPSTDPMGDPFGPSPAGSTDPFDTDPFGGGAPASTDPFGDNNPGGVGADPFGGNTSPFGNGGDPFGGQPTTTDDLADPFGGSSAAASDPFGN